MFLPKIWLICRICLKQKCAMLNLYTRHQNRPIWGVLRDVSGLPIRKDDDFSDKICHVCLERLWKAYAFRMDCQRAHRELFRVVQCEDNGSGDYLPIKQQLGLDVITDDESFKSLESEPLSSLVTVFHDWTNLSAESTSETKSNDQDYVENATNIATEDNTKHIKTPIVLLEAIEPPIVAQTVSKESALQEKLQKFPKCKKSPSMRKTRQSVKTAPAEATASCGTEKLSCELCKLQFKTEVLREKHMAEHDKAFICSFCGKSFRLEIYLKEHYNMHNGLKPHPCRLCPSRFTWMSNRNKHERTIHKRKLLRGSRKSTG